MFYNDHLLIQMQIPITELNEKYEVFRIFNIETAYIPNNDSDQKVIAKYQLENDGLIYNKERTKFSVLISSELDVCQKTS
jgi:hypothetical protein